MSVPQPANAAATPWLSVRDTTVTETDGSGQVAHVRVVLSQKASKQVRVQYETANGTAKSWSDFTAKSGELVFPAGVTTKEVSVRVSGDTLDEDNEQFRVRIFDPAGAKIADRRGTVTVRDDDPLPSLRIGGESVTEGDEGSERAMDFPVRLSTRSGRSVSVEYSVSDGTATEDRDYTVTEPSGELYFPAGTTTRRVRTTVMGDDTDEVDETVRASLSSARNADLSDDSAVGTIEDDDGPDVSIRNDTVTEGGTAKLAVRLSDPSEQDVRFDFETDDGSAKEPDDYTSESGSKTIDAGDEEVTISVDTEEDSKDEKDEKFSVDLSHVRNASLDDGHGVVTIEDDDGPEISVENDRVTEGGTMKFKVTLSEDSVQDIRFHFDTDEGTAESPEDFDAVSGSKTIEAGDDEVTISVDTEDDTLAEGDEKFYLDVTDPEGATIEDGRATGTVVDDDEEGQPEISVPDDQAPEGKTVTFWVTLDKEATSKVTVDWETENGSARSPGDFDGGSGTVSIGVGEKVGFIRIDTVQDDEVEGDETFQVRLFSPVNATIADGAAQGLIVDDD